MKSILTPIVSVRRDIKISLDELRKRVAGSPNVVRIGLPDNMSAEEGASKRKARTRSKGRTK